MHRYLIERNIPGAEKMSPGDLKAAAQKSNAVLHELGPDVQWVHSFVGKDAIYCEYLANGEEIVREHARKSGFPANRITEIRAVIDPTTAA
jgi:hypothetical protein